MSRLGNHIPTEHPPSIDVAVPGLLRFTNYFWDISLRILISSVVGAVGPPWTATLYYWPEYQQSTSTAVSEQRTFALPNRVWDADKQDKNMTGTRSSAEQRLPSQLDGVANGLSIKGAAARRQQALEHASSKETAATSVDQGNALLETSVESTALPVSECTKGKDEEIINAINNPSVNAEIASVGKHLTTTAPTLDNHPLPHYHPDETGAQSGTSRTSISDMPPLQSAGFSRTASGEGLSSRRKDMSNSPKIPGWISSRMAAIQASNPARPLAYTGLQLPNSIQPSVLQGYHEGRELGIVRWPGSTADANPSTPVPRIEAWVHDGEMPLPPEPASLNASPNIDSTKKKPETVTYRAVLRDQSTNFPMLESPAGHYAQAHVPTFKVQTKWGTTHLTVLNQAVEDGSRARADGSKPPFQALANHEYNQRLATNSSEFLSKVTATLNNLKQPLSSQARSPLSTERTLDELSSPVEKTITSPAAAKPAASVHEELHDRGLKAHEGALGGERIASTGIVDNGHKSQDSGEPMQKSIENHESTESVRGQADEPHLSSVPESMFFEYAYNGRDASASEVVFEGRNPRNPYKDPRVKCNQVSGWEGVEGPAYQPGQLVGWDGNWQEAPVEWGRRDLYDYTAEEHQQNVKNFIDDRYGRYTAGECPAIEIISDPLFMSGRALATGLPYFAKHINDEDHHHIPPEDPFSQGKLTKTTTMSIESYLRVHSKRLKEQENREHAVDERKKAAKAQRAEQRAREQAIAEAATAPNPYEPKINIFIRPAEPKDLPQICAIHNYYIRTSALTGERVELTEREWRTRFDTCREDKFPFLVAILVLHSKMNRRHGRTERVVGFTYIEDFAGELTMWGHTCELQIFVDYQYLHQGIGKNLMDCVLRGVDPNYQARNGVQFVFTPGLNDRYEGGGERVISNIIFPLPYTAEEDEHAQRVGEWLKDEFGFKLQGLLVGIGRVQKWGRRVNLAYYVAETGARV
ncbi:MAG: hypothetical protein Q9205_001937 [Flavoplaca limonia]